MRKRAAMSTLRFGVVLGIVLTLGVAAVAAMTASGTPIRGETADALERACAGPPTDREVENVLLDVRVESNGGSGPIYEEIESQAAGAAKRASTASRYKDANPVSRSSLRPRWCQRVVPGMYAAHRSALANATQ